MTTAYIVWDHKRQYVMQQWSGPDALFKAGDYKATYCPDSRYTVHAVDLSQDVTGEALEAVRGSLGGTIKVRAANEINRRKERA